MTLPATSSLQTPRASPATVPGAVHLWGSPAALAVLTAALCTNPDGTPEGEAATGGPVPGGSPLVPQGDPLGDLLDDLLAPEPADPASGPASNSAGPAPSAPDPARIRALAAILADTLTAPLADRPGTAVIVSPGLAEVLARALPVRSDAALGLALWTALNEVLLAAWARLRRQLIVIPAPDLEPGAGSDGVSDTAADTVARLIARLDLPPVPAGAPSGQSPSGQSGTDTPDGTAPVPSEMRLVAATLLQTQRPARDLLGRIEASGLPRDPGFRSADSPDALRAVLGAAVGAQRRALSQRDRLHGLANRRQEMKVEAEAQEARRHVDALTARIDTLRTALADATRNLAGAEVDTAQAVAAREAISERLDLQAAEIVRLRADLEAAARDDAARIADLGRLARDIALRDGRIRLLAEAVQRGEDEVSALRTSHSWRLTAPLRGVSLVARRLKP